MKHMLTTNRCRKNILDLHPALARWALDWAQVCAKSHMIVPFLPLRFHSVMRSQHNEDIGREDTCSSLYNFLSPFLDLAGGVE